MLKSVFKLPILLKHFISGFIKKCQKKNYHYRDIINAVHAFHIFEGDSKYTSGSQLPNSQAKNISFESAVETVEGDVEGVCQSTSSAGISSCTSSNQLTPSRTKKFLMACTFSYQTS